MLKNKIIQALATFFGVGYLPVWPGAWGSAVALPIAYLAGANLGWLTLIVSVLGVTICKQSREVLNHEDPHSFVLDEVCGMWVSLFMLPVSWKIWLAAFILFRILDTLKPWPIILFQRLKAPSSIMWDDLVAGFITNILIQVGLVLFP